MLGTQLTAYVFFAAVTGQSPVGLPTPRGITDEDAAALQAAAWAVVFDDTDAFSFPWEAVAEEDTGEVVADSGSADPDTDQEPASDEGEDSEDRRRKQRSMSPQGVRQLSDRPSVLWLLVGVALLGLRGPDVDGD